MNLFKRFAFTLNEVMIVLAVLGIVAALTMPTLNANIQSRKWSATSQDFVRELEESLKIMNLKKVLAGHATTKSFVSKLSEYISVVKICNNDELLECFSDKVTWGLGEATPEEIDMTKVKKAKHFGLDDWKSELIGVQFNNGVNALVAYNPECSANHLSNDNNLLDCVAMLYDVSGFAFPNQSGKDLKTYGVISKLGPSDCLIEANGRCFTAAQKITGTLTRAECLELINSGKYGSMFSSNECSNGTQKQLLAIDACGGINNLPSESDVRAMSKILHASGTIDKELCTQLNFVSGGSFPCRSWSDNVGYMYIWISNLNGGSGRKMGFNYSGTKGPFDLDTTDYFMCAVD